MKGCKRNCLTRPKLILIKKITKIIQITMEIMTLIVISTITLIRKVLEDQMSSLPSFWEKRKRQRPLISQS
jgi:hypothetical protein